MQTPMTHPTMKTDGKVYTIRKDGQTIVRSTIQNCGYTDEELKSLRAAGYELFADGKKVGQRQRKTT